MSNLSRRSEYRRMGKEEQAKRKKARKAVTVERKRLAELRFFDLDLMTEQQVKYLVSRMAQLIVDFSDPMRRQQYAPEFNSFIRC